MTEKITPDQLKSLRKSGKLRGRLRPRPATSAKERQLQRTIDQLKAQLGLTKWLLDRFECEVRLEYQFCPYRRYRADYVILSSISGHRRLIIELDGGAWQGHGHFSHKGRESDNERDRVARDCGFDTDRFVWEEDPKETVEKAKRRVSELTGGK